MSDVKLVRSAVDSEMWEIRSYDKKGNPMVWGVVQNDIVDELAGDVPDDGDFEIALTGEVVV